MRKEILELYRKSNVIELALAIVLAQYAVSWLNAIMYDFITPLFGLVDGGRSLPSLFVSLTPNKLTSEGGPIDSIEKARYAGVPIIAYGSFLEGTLQVILVVLLAWGVLAWLRRMHSASQVKINMPVPLSAEKNLPKENESIEAFVQ